MAQIIRSWCDKVQASKMAGVISIQFRLALRPASISVSSA